MNKEKLPFRRGDFLLSGVLLFAAAVIGFYSLRLPSGTRARITRGNDTLHIADLPVATSYSIEAEGNGIHLIVEFDGRKARVAYSSCPDQLCVRAGWLGRTGSTAACVPAGIVLRVEGGRSDVDAVLR